MPFNEKGEFIRSKPNPAHQQQSQTNAVTTGWKVVSAIFIGLLTIAALIGVVWAFVAFRNWILIGLWLWAVACIRRVFR